MENIKLKSSKIIFDDSYDGINKYIEEEQLFIITDINVNNLYKNNFPIGYVCVIGTGEKIKTGKTIEKIYAELLDNGFDRKSFILGIGGGIVCDIAGFVASTYMRGVDFGFIPTTLLAQIDASIGGKNGINFNNYKNIIGTVNMPKFILINPVFLDTLNNDEYINGLSETIKHGLIGNSKLFYFLRDNQKAILERDTAIIEKMINTSVKVKVNIVRDDEFENEKRKLLNFGHTIGHAIELNEDISHGQAISVGMNYAGKLSEKLGYTSSEQFREINGILKSFGLPTETKTQNSEIIKAIWKDKKKAKQDIDFILIEKIGKAFIKRIKIEDLEGLLNDMC